MDNLHILYSVNRKNLARQLLKDGHKTANCGKLLVELPIEGGWNKRASGMQSWKERKWMDVPNLD